MSDPDHAYIYSQLVHQASPTTDTGTITQIKQAVHHHVPHQEITAEGQK